jgi:hypothetical protein
MIRSGARRAEARPARSWSGRTSWTSHPAGASFRNARTAATLRCTGALASCSLAKIEFTCFSTVDPDRCNACSMPELVSPWAIALSTSSSRGARLPAAPRLDRDVHRGGRRRFGAHGGRGAGVRGVDGAVGYCLISAVRLAVRGQQRAAPATKLDAARPLRGADRRRRVGRGPTGRRQPAAGLGDTGAGGRHGRRAHPRTARLVLLAGVGTSARSRGSPRCVVLPFSTTQISTTKTSTTQISTTQTSTTQRGAS